MDMLRRVLLLVRYAWVLPATLLGLACVPLALWTGGGVQVVDGVLEIHGGIVRWLLCHCVPLKGGASALTLGHTVLGRDRQVLEHTRPHERIHVHQYERWGPLFIPAYGVASLAAKLRGGSAYLDNRFEREAYAGSR